MVCVGVAMSGEERVGSIQRARDFFSGCKEELLKVSHPTTQETVQATLVTITIMVFVAALLFVADLIFDQIMKVMISV